MINPLQTTRFIVTLLGALVLADSGVTYAQSSTNAPRADVAGLTGTAWLKWLDSGLDKPAFADGAGRALVELPCRRPGAEHGADVDALLRAVRRRLATPLPATRGGS